MEQTRNRLRKFNTLAQAAQVGEKRHAENMQRQEQLTRAVTDSIGALIRYLDSHTSKTEVVNHRDSISTPDIDKAVRALESMHETLKTHENVDLSGVASLLKSISLEVEKLPKELPQIDIPSEITVKNQPDMSELAKIHAAIKGQKLVVPAPEVSVNPAEVKVDVEAPDLSPITRAVEKLDKTTKGNRVDIQDTRQINTLITEPYDRFKIVYNDFDEESDRINGIQYFMGKKKVADLKFKYDKDERFVGLEKS